ncbi:MAG: hypothetical protein ACRDWB_07830, partial [Acidimicrobiales bacterium]
ALAIGALRPGKRGRRIRRAAAALALVPPVVEWWQRRPDLDPFRWSVASIADDVAYGLGVWAGCIRTRTFDPLLPSLQWGWPDPEPAAKA